MDPRELRKATRAEHEATEALMPLLGPELTLELYVRVLQVLLPLLRSWETWVDSVTRDDLQGMLQRRRRSHFLVADLTALGAGPAETGTAGVDWHEVVSGPEGRAGDDPDSGRFAANLLGAVYVMEGSTLGGRFLARHVEESLGLEPGVGDSYFQGHEEDTGWMWHEILDKISAIPEVDAALTVAAAKRTFEAFGEALRTGLNASQMVRR